MRHVRTRRRAIDVSSRRYGRVFRVTLTDNIPSVDLVMATFSGIASASISTEVPVISQNLCYAAIPDSRTGAVFLFRRLVVGAFTPTFPARTTARSFPTIK